ncbi:hypothetical protein N806_31210 [Rhodococcus sp. P27]|nr:hypothetical protein N806_31210 [Rhodococcus sp. P27]
MASIRHKLNGGLADVSDEYAERLIATCPSEWELAKTKPAPAARKTRKTAQKPAGATNTGE